ncbi:MAG TPA: ATP-binding cassette domain-containing protein [Kofleriaceae bacterium]|nr:ATP-binding cassette domain-containing protein [Kofleriaceae bacterium]
MSDVAVEIRNLWFRYRNDDRDSLAGVDLAVKAGSRCLLVGANGAGKTTLLRIIAGKHMVDPAAARVLGRPAFHDTTLADDVEYLGGSFAFDVDVKVSSILSSAPASDGARRAALIDLLGVDLGWHMHRISDGQRRRVQLLLGLMRPFKVLCLDEITTDLDLIARRDLLAFLKEDSETRGATFLYATHILDRLDEWATHVAYIRRGKVVLMVKLEDLPGLADAGQRGESAPLSRAVEALLRAEGRPADRSTGETIVF